MLFFKERKNKIEYYEIVKTLKHTQFHGKFIVFFFYGRIVREITK